MPNDAKSKFLVQVISTNNIIRSTNLLAETSNQEIVLEISEGIIPSTEEFNSGKLHSKILTNLICQRKISKAEVGCALAHKKSIESLQESDFEFSIIFEDDAQVLEVIDFERLNQYLNVKIPRIVNLGWIPGYALTLPTNLQKDDYFLRVAFPPTCAFAYALNKAAAKWLLSSKKVIDLADWPIETFNRIEYAIPKIPWASAPQEPSQSLIGIRTSKRKIKFVSSMISRFRLVLSFVFLLPLSRILGANISFRQAFNRILIKDHFYNYGVTQINSALVPTTHHGQVEIPIKTSNFLNRIGLYKLLD